MKITGCLGEGTLNYHKISTTTVILRNKQLVAQADNH